MRDLTVTLVQEQLKWEDPAANRAQLGAVLETLEDTDLALLPEMFTTGFSTASTAHAESMDGATVDWLREKSLACGFALAGSVKIEEGGHCYNRMIWVTPDGELEYYDKRHLFRMANEHERYAAGSRRVTVKYLGWRILLQVCYDLRFPVFSRNRNDYDLIVYVANWPAARRGAWTRLLPARAIENLCYCAGVNRVGADGNDVEYAGDSAIIDFRGDSLLDLGDRAGSGSATLSWRSLERYREKFPAHLDADEFQIGSICDL